MAREEAFGWRISEQLQLAVIEQSHHLGVPMELYVDELRRVRGKGRSAISEILAATKPADVPSATLGLSNVLGYLREPGLKAYVRESMKAALGELKDGPEKVEAAGILEADDLREGLAAAKKAASPESMDSAEIVKKHLDRWSDRQDLWVYAGVADTLISTYGLTDRLEKEASKLLDADEFQDSNMNSYHILAMEVLRNRRAAQRNTIDVAVQFLRKSAPKWEGNLTIDQDVQAFSLLHTLDPTNRLDYEGGLARALERRVERDHVRRIPMLIEDRQFFAIFLDYYSVMRHWGLPTDREPESMEGMLEVTREEARVEIGKWQQEGGSIPAPLVTVSGRQTIGARFLLIGRCLGELTRDGQSDLQVHLRKFDHAAEVAIYDLLDMFTTLPDAPSGLKELFEIYRSRFDTRPPRAAAART